VVSRQLGGDLRGKTAKLRPRHANQFVDPQQPHYFVHRCSAASIAALCGGHVPRGGGCQHNVKPYMRTDVFQLIRIFAIQAFR
jgi:hypothetical protein